MLAGWQLGPLLVSTAPEGESGLGYLFSQSCGGPAPQHPASQGPQARQTLHPPAQEAGVGWRHTESKDPRWMRRKFIHSLACSCMFLIFLSFQQIAPGFVLGVGIQQRALWSNPTALTPDGEGRLPRVHTSRCGGHRHLQWKGPQGTGAS